MSSCNVCGSSQTKVLDGLMYCDVCGTQIFDFREIEAEDENAVRNIARISKKKIRGDHDKSRADIELDTATLGLTTAHLKKSKRRKGEGLEETLRFSSRVERPKQSCELISDYKTARDHAPVYLRRIGTRLSTFTKMLAKGSHVFAIYQRYLAACGVAYTSGDYTEDLEVMFRALVLNTNLASERAREKKERKVRRKKRGKEALEKSTTAWDLLMSETLNENLELHSDEEQENAASIYLSLDVVVALLYVSAVTIGCKWILVSDIVRWVREGRLGISLFQLTALQAGAIENSGKSGQSWWMRMDIPLYEFHRTTLFVWQLCRLPATPARLDFEQLGLIFVNHAAAETQKFFETLNFMATVIFHLLHHVNLPKSMMIQIALLLEKAPPCARIDDGSLRRQGSIQQGPFSDGFCSNSKQKFCYSDLLTAFGRPNRDCSNRNTDIFFSAETKAFAYILLALKLCFGLDDEFRMSSETQDHGGYFNFMNWFHQLKMRIMFWEGYDPLDILQENKPVEPMVHEKYLERGQLYYFYPAGEPTEDNREGYALSYNTRDAGFTNCIPPAMRIDSSTSIPNPFPEDTSSFQSGVNDDESLYYPLRRQTTALRAFLLRPRTDEEKEEIRNVVDESAVKVFKTDFAKSEIANTKSLGNNIFPVGNDRRATWQNYFPCAKEYQRYPRPRFTNGGVLRLKPDDERMRVFNRRMGLTNTTSGLRQLFASRKGATDALESARMAMSYTFKTLLKWFSKIIGESESILYCAFMMLEYQIVDQKRFEEIKQSIVDGRIYPVESTVVDKYGHRTFNKLHVSSGEDVDDAREVELVRFGLPRYWECQVRGGTAVCYFVSSGEVR
ncbi:unnamed protein product [Nippostrongylus brasiliensis]|uniref:TATA box-binding protein-associated factor RNA polymerase I subunit B n=1 Tax=Nippostrongylus brasiliensis TaxID=27835 RepID=A0A0N4YJ20_NIPBR|nr:unnamed protein product [Nippostrongylus brasiliensis]